MVDVRRTIDLAEGKYGRTDLRDKILRFQRRSARRIRLAWYDPAETSLRTDAVRVVREFLAHRERRALPVSSEQDYSAMIHNPGHGKNQRDHITFLLYDDREPVALYIANRLGGASAGVYANMTLFWKVQYLSEYLNVAGLRELAAVDVRTTNLGGSETSGLHEFKAKFEPSWRQRYWVVAS